MVSDWPNPMRKNRSLDIHMVSENISGVLLAIHTVRATPYFVFLESTFYKLGLSPLYIGFMLIVE